MFRFRTGAWRRVQGILETSNGKEDRKLNGSWACANTILDGVVYKTLHAMIPEFQNYRTRFVGL